MPCHSEPSYKEIDREQRFRDITTRLACFYCRRLELAGIPIPDWAVEWWRYHKKQDAKEKREHDQQRLQAKLKHRALSRLSVSERKALGL